MVAMTIADAWPTTGRAFTTDDLDRMPDDGHRYELLDGVLIVSPRPSWVHQDVAGELLMLLRQGCPAGLRVFAEPAVQLTAHTEFDPDIVVASRARLDRAKPKLSAPPLLVVEVRSPSTAMIDLSRKKLAYERFGVESYWIVVPDADQPELVAFELCDGHYEEVAHVTGDQVFRAGRPFSIEIVPSRLVAGVLD
ncbi:MAG TPA: Uma2 family endonuclease [Streptosporangiaceae bacterium]|nr:Uma2 family endonuclease [Streptosporangiaceae bacterium]